MFRLITAGLIYLIGISIVLTIKPSFMFSEDGTWKEFGIGRNTKTHTWMPFWLFAVLWALISYILVSMYMALMGMNKPVANIVRKTEMAETVEQPSLNVVDEIVDVSPEDIETASVVKPRRGKYRTGRGMADGYYILNRRATELSGGIPKYVYLGKALPN
jgi:hypothetical protein